MSGLRKVARTASAFALGAFVAGAIHATRTIWPRTWVLEFQAGTASTATEKLAAIVQSAAIEGFGFLVIGAVLALVALAVARLLPRPDRDPEKTAFGASLILCAGAYFGWVNLAWIAEDALAFLTRPELVLLDLAGFFGLLAALAFFHALAQRCPWSPAAADAGALGALAGGALTVIAALAVVRSGDEGWRDPTLLALALVVGLAGIPVAGLLGRILAPPVALVRERLRRGPLLPARAALLLWVLLAAAGAWTALHFELSPVRGEPSYATLTPRPDATGATGANAAGPNVVFVTVDTLRADHLGCYGYPRPTSPFLDSLAREGTVCADASASASWTKPATGTILTGLHPSRHGALYHGSLLRLPEGEQTLAEAFRERGWTTAGFVANPNLKRVFEFDRGFDEYFDSPVEDTVTLACIRGTWFGGMLMKLLRHQFNWNYENDISAMNREVLAWLDANAHQRFFLYAHYIDPHIPYDPPAKYREEFRQEHGFALFNDRKRKVGIDLYDGEIRYTDDGLQELVAKLVELGVWENTLFVLTSDHGEEFFEHGVLGHGFSLYQEVVHVPLILRGPGVPAGKVLEAPVQILDLPATVLALAGTDVNELGDGKSFHARLTGSEPTEGELQYLESEFGQDDSNHREFVFTGLRYGPYKLVLTEANEFFPPSDPRFGREALYDLGADPTERKNLFRETRHAALLEGLLDRLRAHAQFLQEQGFRDIAPAALTPEIEASLKALGYIGEE